MFLNAEKKRIQPVAIHNIFLPRSSQFFLKKKKNPSTTIYFPRFALKNIHIQEHLQFFKAIFQSD